MNLRLRLRLLWQRLLWSLGMNQFLCTRCVYNNPRDCRHRARPRATVCEDYRRR